MQQFSVRQVRDLGITDVTRAAEAANQLARTLGATEPWVRLRGDTIQVDDAFASFVQSQATGRYTGGTAASDTPGW